MEHAINVAAGHFAQAITPMSNSHKIDVRRQSSPTSPYSLARFPHPDSQWSNYMKTHKHWDTFLSHCRFESPLKPMPFSVSHVQRSTYQSLSLSTGSTPIGHHFSHALITFLCCRRQVFPVHFLQVLIECRGSITSSTLLMTVRKYLN
jgi:hypothetical protein